MYASLLSKVSLASLSVGWSVNCRYLLSFSSFRVTPTLVHPFLEGMSLDAALKSLRLFIVDYSILDKADVDSERAVSIER